ncbi:hypothetical protein N7493_011659 [Penicillium malachiteum]|uniref:CCHC-type domain-containing protein n=1 Tax=Penicillium malachiteum TaxID=1324776 RepID=A0AAD6HA85_9EURO|nr:hypothetical protein N7493_011659 [Penicillium malachiteum]
MTGALECWNCGACDHFARDCPFVFEINAVHHLNQLHQRSRWRGGVYYGPSLRHLLPARPGPGAPGGPDVLPGGGFNDPLPPPTPPPCRPPSWVSYSCLYNAFFYSFIHPWSVRWTQSSQNTSALLIGVDNPIISTCGRALDELRAELARLREHTDAGIARLREENAALQKRQESGVASSYSLNF